jgi:hypothetical protein
MARALNQEERSVRLKLRAKILSAVAALLAIAMTAPAVSDEAADNLAAPESFAAVADTAARSAALFTEAGKVLTHPRCVNCHPAGDRPRQGDARRLPAMRCPICHQAANFEPAGVPGNPGWHLAPHDIKPTYRD